ncbi:MAG: beta-N-acetylglucosaminidase domain-containing protein, partial [Firmicutes bacterium]|nr:beta-N-acetylglucosaminidase domain-containing protein [Bacillota bacterium]
MPSVIDPEKLLPRPKQLFWKGEYLTLGQRSMEILSCPDAAWMPAWWEQGNHHDQSTAAGGLAIHLSSLILPETVRALLQGWGWLDQVKMLENEEAYLLAIGPQAKGIAAVIVARTSRGAAWGLRRILQLAGTMQPNSATLSQPLLLPKLCLRDAPDFPLRGIIEGFYGAPWTHEKRLAMIHFLGETMMNSYAYAPKDDPYHRQRWRDAYPENAWRDLGELVAACRREGVNFWFCISPGKDIVFSKEADLAALCDKCAAVEGLGVSHFALLMDDIDPRLSNASDQQRFTSPAAAQASLANRLYDFLRQRDPAVQLLFCPTEYWQPGDSPYRRTLRSTLQPEIGIFWTGIGVVAPQVSSADAAQAQAWFGHSLVLWDNYPVTDFDHSLLLLGPLRNRDAQLPERLHGILANPMELAEASRFA